MGGTRRRMPRPYAHVLVGRERGEHLLAFAVGELVQAELVVVLHEIGPLAGLGDGGIPSSASASGACWRTSDEEQPLVGDEVEHHVHLVAIFVAEEAALVGRGQVRLGEQDRVAPPAGQEGAQVAQVLVRVALLGLLGPGELDQERGERRPGTRTGPARARTRPPCGSRPGPWGW